MRGLWGAAGIRCAAELGNLTNAFTVFFGGTGLAVLFLAVLFGLLFLLAKQIAKHWDFPEEPDETEPETAGPWKSHPFYPVCKRARAAYLVLCFDEVLKAAGQDLERWKWMRNELWSVTRRPEEEWAARVCDLLPAETAFAPTYEELLELRRESPYPEYSFNAAEWKYFHSLYNSIDENAMEQLAFVLSQMADIILDDCGDGETPYTPDSLRFIDETQDYLKSHNIPLPNDENALAHLMKQRNPHSGKPFDPPFKLS